MSVSEMPSAQIFVGFGLAHVLNGSTAIDFFAAAAGAASLLGRIFKMTTAAITRNAMPRAGRRTFFGLNLTVISFEVKPFFRHHPLRVGIPFSIFPARSELQQPLISIRFIFCRHFRITLLRSSGCLC